ncbi:bisanhydrobacterioruberin hydratase CruF [Methanosalsum natronophilum]|uniref:bisanhydrobacterioruberin hydratase CruF n=1 Tax=Methanosalsum natronophilum TaxID=768733 RepID=UPI002169D74D|nr:bisanhydrobacterioruberin hydratase CruF [Methanosalsum natronophilum]MCS3924586.1 putative membrane protein [Methanosalsum natronophilum]
MKDYSKHFYIISLALIISAFFLANVEVSEQHTVISILFIVGFAIPSLIATLIWLGINKGILFICVLGIYAFLLETFAIITGIPYSEFYYTELIGYKLFGLTPFTVPLAWLPLFIGSLYLATKIKISTRIPNITQILLITTLILVITDLVLDPAAVALNFWVWIESGTYYNVPFINFVGWGISGFIAAIIGVSITKNNLDNNMPKAMVSSFFLIMVFWTAICIYLTLIIPAIIGVGLLILTFWQVEGRIGDFTPK